MSDRNWATQETILWLSNDEGTHEAVIDAMRINELVTLRPNKSVLLRYRPTARTSAPGTSGRSGCRSCTTAWTSAAGM